MRIVEENWKVSHVVVSHRVAANRVAVRCGRAIARVSIAWRAIAHADAIVREPGKTGSQWRILYSIRLPGLVCDFFEGTATIGEGSGESLNRLPVGPQELILADADYCSVAGIEYVWQHGADVLVRLNPQSFVAHSACGRRISLLPRLRILSKAGQFGEWRVVLQGQGSWFAGRLCAVRKSDCAIQQAHRCLQRKASKKQMITRPGTLEFAQVRDRVYDPLQWFDGGRSEVLPYALVVRAWCSPGRLLNLKPLQIIP